MAAEDLPLTVPAPPKSAPALWCDDCGAPAVGRFSFVNARDPTPEELRADPEAPMVPQTRTVGRALCAKCVERRPGTVPTA